MKTKRSKCIHLLEGIATNSWYCEAVSDEWFEYCHAIEEDCPFYRELYDQLKREAKIAQRVEKFTGKPFNSCVSKQAIKRLLG